MDKVTKGAFGGWTDSQLAGKIRETNAHKLDGIWNKANEAYPRATWEGWVDHSATHVLSVLRNLELLIPSYTYKTISEAEAFVLIAATLLHDIGMVPQQSASVDLQYLANLRQTHGQRAAEIIRRDFRVFLTPPTHVLNPICEIVRNHHGKFEPADIAGLSYDLRADALWVRLADELDFGPTRAPTWLLDYIRPDEKSLQHWCEHNQISEPAIDLDLFRIQVRGALENDAFIRKIRAEFETSERQDLQKIFLSRGLTKVAHNRSFLIWDLTQVVRVAGDDSKEIDSRPAIFSNDQFLLGARYLYNLGRYDIARRLFEDGVKRLTGSWSDVPASSYFYHYLKTLHALGDHRRALRVAAEYKDAELSPETRAALRASNGIGYWKLAKFASAFSNLLSAAQLYKNLSQRDVKHKVNEADAWVLYAIAALEQARAAKDTMDSEAIQKIERGLKNAETLLSEYERAHPEVSETHYKGRYWGLKAFYRLLQIDSKTKTGRDSEAWKEALQFAKAAYGGDELAHRNPFGIMCGKYCSAVVNFHKYRHCRDGAARRQALLESARLIHDVRQSYDDLFGSGKRIFRLWPRIHRLFGLVKQKLPGRSKLKKRLAHFSGSAEPTEKVQVYTPLH